MKKVLELKGGLDKSHQTAKVSHASLSDEQEPLVGIIRALFFMALVYGGIR